MENKDLAFICFMLFWYLLEEGGPRVKQMGIVRIITLRILHLGKFHRKNHRNFKLLVTFSVILLRQKNILTDFIFCIRENSHYFRSLSFRRQIIFMS